MMVSAEEKRWIVVGVALNKVAAPVLRVAVTNGMDTNCRDLDRHCQSSTPPSSLKTLSYGTVRANPVIFKDLKFQNINNNNLVRGTCNYNFNINSSVDLAKLYLPGYLAQFSAFDESLDMTALLRLLGFKNYMPSTVFSLHTQACADDVRENVRNKWGHVDVTEWTDALFNDCFIKLEKLLKSLGLTATVETKALEQLAEWQTQDIHFGELTPPSLLFPTGCQLIMENSVVKDALYLLQDEVRDLINTMESTLKDQEAWHKKMLDEYHEQLDKVEEKLQKYSENGSEEVKNILKRLSSFEANLSMRLQAIEEGLTDTYGRVEQLEQYQENLNRRCDNADDKVEKIEDELTKLKIGASSKPDYCEEYQKVIINNHVSKSTGNIAVGSSPCILIKGNTDNSTQPPCSSREELQDGEDVPEIHFSRQGEGEKYSAQERGSMYSDVSDDSAQERGSMYSDVSDGKHNTSLFYDTASVGIPCQSPPYQMIIIACTVRQMQDVSILINFLIITVAGKKAKVIFSYDAKKEDELTLNVGDIVDILRVTEEDGWWSGQLGSKEGLFPSNYVEVIEYENVAEANNSAVETKHSKLAGLMTRLQYHLTNSARQLTVTNLNY
ncbi:unnamed protein product [Porites evermanni]|uniref:SH3 domain-containing protein n=1 Tax=Porites evermanni TaxID=104178 RepID=A0ABN8RHQ5_9CNID|nr:unnamed protein product [Porites evermanni]